MTAWGISLVLCEEPQFFYEFRAVTPDAGGGYDPRPWRRIRVRIDIWKVAFIHSFIHAAIILWAPVLCQTLCYIFRIKVNTKMEHSPCPHRAYSWMESEASNSYRQAAGARTGEAEGVWEEEREEGRAQRRLPRRRIIWQGESLCEWKPARRRVRSKRLCYCEMGQVAPLLCSVLL